MSAPEYPGDDCPICRGKWVERSERVFHPTPDDNIRVRWVCENGHVAVGGEKWLREDTDIDSPFPEGW